MTRPAGRRRLRDTKTASQTPECSGVRARKGHAAVHTVSSERYVRYGIDDASAPAARTYGESEDGHMPRETTMLELVTEVARDAQSDAEIVETVVALVNSGAVRLCGNFRGRTFEPCTLEAR
jgi:hypothetical protein